MSAHPERATVRAALDAAGYIGLDDEVIERAAQAAAEHIGWQAGMYDAIRAALTAACADAPSDLRTAVQAVLWNASNYPERVQSRMLGQDVAPLTAKVLAAIRPWLAAHDAEVRADERRRIAAEQEPVCTPKFGLRAANEPS